MLKSVSARCIRKLCMSKWYSTFGVVLSLVFLSCAFAYAKERVQTDEELFNRAMELYKKNDYYQAAPVFQEIRDKYPLSPYAIVAELRLADIHYFKSEYIEAIHFYEEFKRLHPTNPEVAYTLYQIGMCYFKQIETSDRDQTPADNAVFYFEQLVDHYPTSPFTGKAMGKLTICRQKLFDHDFYIGRFYYKSKKYEAAQERFSKMLDRYPYVRGKDKLLFYLAQTYWQRNDQSRARDILLALIKEYPQSEYSVEAKRLLETSPGSQGKGVTEGRQEKK